MTHLFSGKLFLTKILFFFCLLFSLSSFAILPENKSVQWQGSSTEQSLLKQSTIISLKRLDKLIAQLPPKLSDILKKEMVKQFKLLNTESFAYSITELLSWLCNQMTQVHKVNITKGTFNNQPVYYISLGYLAFYILAADGKQGYAWNKHKQQWDTLESESIRHLKVLWRMKKKYQPRSWVMIPVATDRSAVVFIKDAMTVQKKASFSAIPVFSETINKRIEEQLWKINQQLKKSSLSLLLSPTLTFDPQNSITSLQTILSQLIQLIIQGTQINYVELPENEVISSQKNRRFLFAGPFSVIFKDTFFYKNFTLNQLQKVDGQPSLGFALQADAVFQGEKTTLIPVDPFFNDYSINKKNKLSDYFFQDFFTIILCLIGSAGLIIICFRAGTTSLAVWRINIGKMTNKNYRFNKILRRLLRNCHQESQEKWINIMYAMLIKEKTLQKKIEQWIVNLILCIAASGLLLTAIRLFKVACADVIIVSAVIQALVALVMTLILCIVLLIGHACIITVHRFFLLKLEDSSWKLLFSRETLNKKIITK